MEPEFCARPDSDRLLKLVVSGQLSERHRPRFVERGTARHDLVATAGPEMAKSAKVQVLFRAGFRGCLWQRTSVLNFLGW